MEPAHLGVILDSSIIITAERKGQSVQEILAAVLAAQGEIDVAMSVVTIAEMTHGAYRAKTEEQKARQLEFIDRISRNVLVHPVSIEIARLAGRIEGEQMKSGIQISFEDLLIGATALHLGHGVATLNVRDFQRIPGLRLVQF